MFFQLTLGLLLSFWFFGFSAGISDASKVNSWKNEVYDSSS